MTSAAITSRDRRAIALGVLLLVPPLLFVYGVQPYRRALADVQARTEEERASLRHDHTLTARLATLPATDVSVARQLALEVPRLFDASDDLLATGALSEYVASIASTNGVQLQQAETRPALPAAPGVRALHVSVHAEGDLDGVLHFLRRLETGDKLVRIGQLAVERTRGDVTAGQQPTTEILSVSADVYGYRLTSDSAGGAMDDKMTGAPSPVTRAAYDLPSIETVIDHDPFMPTRTRPAVAYRVATWGDTTAGGRKGASPRGPPCQLVGTVIPSHGHGFAMCQEAGGAARAVHLGTQLAGYTLSALSRARAVFTTPAGGRIELHTPQPGSPQ